MYKINLKIYSIDAAEFIVKVLKSVYPNFMKIQKSAINDGAYIHNTGKYRTDYDWFEFEDDGEIVFVVHSAPLISVFERTIHGLSSDSIRVNALMPAMNKFIGTSEKQLIHGGLQKNKFEEFSNKAEMLKRWWIDGVIEKEAESFIGFKLNPFQQTQFKSCIERLMKAREIFNYVMMDDGDKIIANAKEIYSERLNELFNYLRSAQNEA